MGSVAWMRISTVINHRFFGVLCAFLGGALAGSTIVYAGIEQGFDSSAVAAWGQAWGAVGAMWVAIDVSRTQAENARKIYQEGERQAAVRWGQEVGYRNAQRDGNVSSVLAIVERFCQVAIELDGLIDDCSSRGFNVDQINEVDRCAEKFGYLVDVLKTVKIPEIGSFDAAESMLKFVAEAEAIERWLKSMGTHRESRENSYRQIRPGISRALGWYSAFAMSIGKTPKNELSMIRQH
ncbi:MAG: hypothetical protein KER_03046 [Kerstersia gyiorum]